MNLTKETNQYPVTQEEAHQIAPKVNLIKVYHLKDAGVSYKILKLSETDHEMFELAVIHHHMTRVHHIKDFQTRFNAGLCRGGLIVIK